MENEKIKILKMFENKIINLKEAEELLTALEESYGRINKIEPKEKELKITIHFDESNKKEKMELFFSANDIFISGIMNKINIELKHSGIYLSMEEIKNIKDKILKGEKATIEKNQKKIEIWLE